jgi:phage terminase large subunit-like protein
VYDPAKLAELPDDERRELEAALAELQQVTSRNPLVSYRPHPKQHEFHSSRDSTKVFLGGNQSGKTTAGLVDDLIQAVDADCLPELLQQYKRWEPPFFCRIVAPDFVQTIEKVVFPKLREWVPLDQLLGGGWDAAYSKSERILRFRNGSYFEFLTYEQDRDKHGGATLHRVHYDEEPPQHIRNECAMRLVKHGGDEVYTMTPSLEGAEGWTLDGLWERRHEDDITCVQVSIHDNPHLDPNAVARQLAGFAAEELEARESGRFVHYGGRVYGEFNDATHVVAPIDKGHLVGLDTFVCIDPGHRWTGVTFGCFDGDNDLLIFDELILAKQQDTSKLCEVFSNGVTPAVAAPIILERCQHWDIDPIFVIDPSAKNGTLVNAENAQGEYARLGIRARPAQNQVETGVNMIKRRLQRTDREGGAQSALLVTRNCRRLVWEFGRYRIDPHEDGRFAVIKKDDHVIDSLRYMAMERPRLTGWDVRSKKGFYGWREGAYHVPEFADLARMERVDVGPLGSFS